MDTAISSNGVPIQSGNSGGPLISDDGNLVGVIVATLRKTEQGNTTPQNVNFAVKVGYLASLLESIGILPASKPESREQKQLIEDTMLAVGLVVAK